MVMVRIATRKQAHPVFTSRIRERRKLVCCVNVIKVETPHVSFQIAFLRCCVIAKLAGKLSATRVINATREMEFVCSFAVGGHSAVRACMICTISVLVQNMTLHIRCFHSSICAFLALELRRLVTGDVLTSMTYSR